MSHHKFALVRYATLDRCLGRFRYTKEELMDHCARAIGEVAGEERRFSERTFFNDLQALREGLVLGRMAEIVEADGRYHYAERGFSLFGQNGEELERLKAQLAAQEQRAQEALDLLARNGADAALLAQMRDVLLGEEGERIVRVAPAAVHAHRAELLQRRASAFEAEEEFSSDESVEEASIAWEPRRAPVDPFVARLVRVLEGMG